MSHFSVLVIGDDVDGALAPFHEFECTGINDQFVQEIDITSEALAAYAKDTDRIFISPDGSEHPAYDDQFYRDPLESEKEKIGVLAGTGCGGGISFHSKDWGDGKGYRTKVHFMPEGYREDEQSASKRKSFAEWVESYYGIKPWRSVDILDVEGTHKYGYSEVLETGEVAKVIDRTNPNKKWDWWVVGGRYSGRLLTKRGESVDSCLAGELDMDGIRENRKLEAERFWDKVNKFLAPYPKIVPWKQVMEAHGENIEEARRVYHAQDGVKALRASEDSELAFALFDSEEVLDSREKYVADKVGYALAMFAVIKDGRWYEKGEMGWWGCVHGEKDPETWRDTLASLISGLSPETQLTVVDCHI